MKTRFQGIDILLKLACAVRHQRPIASSHDLYYFLYLTVFFFSALTPTTSAENQIERTIPATLTSAPDDSFSVIIIPDTQDYQNAGTKAVTNRVFGAHVQWILESLQWQRIAFVSHVGDVVDENVPEQWNVARLYMDRLHGRVPYGITVGNHDMSNKGDSSLFQQHFPASRFKGLDWYGGTFAGEPERPKNSGNNANSYQLFSACGLDFVILHLECNAPDPVLAWADDVFEKHRDRIAIVTTHMDLGPLHHPESSAASFAAPKGRMHWSKIHGVRGNSPQQMWDKCFRKQPNLIMICCGDQRRSTAMHLETKGDHGNVVHSLLSDYSPLSKKHLATLRSTHGDDAPPMPTKRWDPLRIYRFLPQQNEIHVMTFDTTRGELIDGTPSVPAREDHQFIIKHDFKRGGN